MVSDLWLILGSPAVTAALAVCGAHWGQRRDCYYDSTFTACAACMGFLPLFLVLVIGSGINRYNASLGAFEKSCTGQVHKLHRGALCISSDGRILGKMP